MSKAPKKRGLSIEEKVSRVEEWFISHPTPYTLKDLLLVLPKATGVIPQSIEECLELLVSENRICQKKIGVHVLFWRFPKTAAQQLAATFNATGGGGASVVARYMNMSLPHMQKELNALREEEAEARRRIQEVRAGIGDDASVRHDTMKMRQLQEEVKALRVELEKAAVFDPVMVEKVKATTRVALESANRWTDNVYLLEHHISQRMGLTPRELRMRLQLPADVDYIEFDELVSDREANPKTTAATLERMSSSPQRAAENAAGGVVEAPSRSPAAEEADTPAAINTGSTHEEEEEEEAAPRNGKKDTRNTQQRIKRGRDDGTVAAKQSQSVVADSPRNDASEDAPGRTVARRGRKKKEL
ncbi:hypothetical protein C3747_69g206 [Trypanosoma cruzi]|uniref:Mnd1 HTH domain-containing protein n=1 Tax=Trypanosoma cruzi TaxID=5693 RepID=A0A2V2WP99_TRYCR|nr:hypothetical protein C3747_69g209 [Trypanosoma cruzi]PWV10381.1 hypothetical protein C3747_69g206 [Trypanosoma cruzi]